PAPGRRWYASTRRRWLRSVRKRAAGLKVPMSASFKLGATASRSAYSGSWSRVCGGKPWPACALEKSARLYVPACPGGTRLKTWPPLQSSNAAPTGPASDRQDPAPAGTTPIAGAFVTRRPAASKVTSPTRRMRSIMERPPRSHLRRSRARSPVGAPGVSRHAAARIGHRGLPAEGQHPDLRRLRVARSRRTGSGPGRARELAEERTRVPRSGGVAWRPVDARALDVWRVARQAGGIGVAVEAVLRVRGGLVGE